MEEEEIIEDRSFSVWRDKKWVIIIMIFGVLLLYASIISWAISNPDRLNPEKMIEAKAITD